jgi:hypothetical protein
MVAILSLVVVLPTLPPTAMKVVPTSARRQTYASPYKARRCAQWRSPVRSTTPSAAGCGRSTRGGGKSAARVTEMVKKAGITK